MTAPIHGESHNHHEEEQEWLEGSRGDSPSQLIEARIKELSDWRGETLARVRTLIKQADPDVVEERKWRGIPVWEHAGIICTGETYKTVVKMTFAGALSGGVETGRPPGKRVRFKNLARIRTQNR